MSIVEEIMEEHHDRPWISRQKAQTIVRELNI
jgi:hypothetical protein